MLARGSRAAGGRGGTAARLALAATEAGSGGGLDPRGRGTEGVGRGGFAGAFFQTGAPGAGRATTSGVIAVPSSASATSTCVRSSSTANGSGFRAITIVGSSLSIELPAALLAGLTCAPSIVPH